MKLRRRASEDVSGFLDKGINMTGELEFAGMVRIDGSFHGSISTDDILVVGEHAVIHADIKVGEIEIHGQIFGNVRAKRSVEVFATGRVRGDIHTGLLSIVPGGRIDGQILMEDTCAPEPVAVTSSVSTDTNTPRERN
jgi:cytoskeletal protein CcmA (bactofilin family)